MSTTPPSASPEQQQASSPSQHDSSLLSQSQLSLADDSALQLADVEKHPKGKRKRTAAKDKMMLEEAYRTNPKPDKQARQEIVDRVSLNEKEVQIWFQNRRQNDRRKSRPLSPEELAALRFGGMHQHHVPSSDPVTSDRGFPSSDPASSRSADQTPVSPSFATTLTRPHLTRSYSDAVIATPRVGGMGRDDASPPQSQETPPPSSSQNSHESASVGHSLSSSVGYLANRWNLGSSFSTPSTLGRGGDDSLRPASFPSSASSDRTHTHGKSQSHMRLSLSLEGKAELISNQASPTRPPPARTTPSSAPQPRQRAGLSRSHSALPGITLPPISALTSSLPPPPRLVRGRSRDVHAWESCADSERRDELTTQAENESNGSAIAAISLLRSTSGVLQPSSTKRNASLSRTSQQPRQAKKAKLSRTGSTLARIETIDVDAEKRDSTNKVKVSMLVSPTDSDKENWSPGSDGNTHAHQRRRPLPVAPASKVENPRRLGRILQDHKGSSMLSNRAHTAPSPLGSKSSIAIFEDGKPPREDEVEKFMRGDVSPSKKPDMDCVAGLLSLSQGAWR